MSRLYLVRHGVHDLVGKTLAGRMPGVHLGEVGRGQAQRLAASFAARDVAQILSSPLERCRETAAPIADRLGLEVVVNDALDEIDCGDWTGESFATLTSDPRWKAWNGERAEAAIPNGETMKVVQARVMTLVADFAAREQDPAILVSHSDVIKAVVLTLLGASLDWHDRLEIEPASITTVDLWPGGGKIVRTNEVVAA